ncbi:MAG: hypothetical protein ACI9HK_001541, partial [Pirellulaceae bacterium]
SGVILLVAAPARNSPAAKDTGTAATITDKKMRARISISQFKYV